MTTIDPSEKQYQLDPQVARVLKRGDWARINSNKPGKLMDHNEDLARVVKVTEVGPSPDNSHAFVYDLELMMGGKLHEVARDDLLYTTATKEGMIGDSRMQRQRKPNKPFDAEVESEVLTKTKAKVGKKTKTATAKKGKAGTTAAKSNLSKNRSVDEKGKDSSKKAKLSASESNTVSPTVGGHAMDLFERHRKEFERSVSRLEKADAYNFFGTLVPPEFEESYSKQKAPDGSDSVQPHCNSSILEQHNGLASGSQSPSPETPTTENQIKKNKDDSKDSKDENTLHFPSTPPFNFVVIRRRMELGRYILDRVRLENEERINLLTPYWKSIGRKNINRRLKKSPIPVLHPQGINWDVFRNDIHDMCNAAVERNMDLDDVGPGTLAHSAGKIKELVEHLYEKIGHRHFSEMTAANDRHRFSLAMDQKVNKEAAMQSKWKKDAFPERKYERLRGDVVCAGLSPLDEKIAAYELKTALDDRFIGVAYKYDDTGQSEGWMKSVLDVTGEANQHQEAARALASDKGAIKAQVYACMQSILIGVVDNAMTDSGLLQQNELRCANWENETAVVPDMLCSSKTGDPNAGPEFVVHEVWGIDCYTRKNITICLEIEFDSDTVLTFTEKWLLPAINACPADLAYDISNSCLILEGLSFDVSTSLVNDKGTTFEQWKDTVIGRALLKKMMTNGPPWLKAAAHLLRRANANLGPDFFRIHPKGHGSIVLCDELQPNRLVTFYRGEIYPSWRWGEKIDAIAKIQEQKGLKPVLPDFFNMMLERPQHDPRGYGLLHVDATRKSNYGSMLSHSCQPSCEVHVVAVNGELRLAITTIRELTIGDELTFDYNAVTESFFEYQSAVCLCGHGQCSGSFLHFAAADCYQQVFHRNSPVASRLANIIKSCTKKVMSDEDDRILKRHGFQTAAFGAVSVNRRNASALENLDTTLDSMNIVPVWLRTYVADTLRYIEYERRALPVALICNDLYDETGNVPQETESNEGKSSGDEAESSGDVDHEESCEEEELDKPVKRSRPEPTYSFYARTQREYFISLLADDDEKATLCGAELKRETQKLTSVHWKSLDTEAKETWKTMAFEDWKRNNIGLASHEEDKKKPKAKKKKNERKPKKEKGSNIADGKGSNSNTKPKISFQEADGEGVSAMEQRIQQLTQTLSRVGRVLDRHREATLRSRNGSNQAISDETLRDIAHSPLVIMPDEHVVAWMWNHSEGIVRTLVKYTENDICVSPELRRSIMDTVSKHAILEQFGTPKADQMEDAAFPMSPMKGRERLNEALLALRKNLLDGIQQMTFIIKKKKSKSSIAARKMERQDELARAQESPEKPSIRSTVDTLLQEMVTTVEKRPTGATSIEKNENRLALSTSLEKEQYMDKTDVGHADFDLDPWLQNFNKRFKIEKAADLLLLYAKTGNFFSIKGYQPLKSSPIEVYARDLGNAVPASTIDRELLLEPDFAARSLRQSLNPDAKDEIIERVLTEENGVIPTPMKNTKQLCDPEDIVSNVVVEYQGDYVLSQLLQWYNGGIGQRPGLPDSLGCILLPPMKGCWTVDGTTVKNSYTDRATRYQSSTRRRLIEWFKDPLKRGNPWPDDVRKAFVDKEDDIPVADSTSTLLPLGSPILDFLVTGDDHNMNSVTDILSRFHSSSSRNGNVVGDGLLSTVDEGRPAEAISNWAQCENPDCQKWRKLPWHVDVNILPQFFCKDNIWNTESASCEDPEDEWDQTADAQVGVDCSKFILHESTLDTSKGKSTNSSVTFKLCDFQLGARFDVHREGKKGWTVGAIVKLDLAGDLKRIKVHYSKMQMKYDEWIDIDSPRIAPLYSHVRRCSKDENTDSGNKKRGTKTTKLKEMDQNGSNPKKAASKKKHSGDRLSEISDDHTAEKTHIIHTDDSSMADVFLQDSDDETPVQKQASKPTFTRRNCEDESEEGHTLDSAPSVRGGFVLEDSDEGESILPQRGQPVGVTDESSPDEGRNTTEKTNETSSTWTIPKKKSLPVQRSLLSAVPEDSLSSAFHADKPNSEGRIPRKKPSAVVSHSESLIMTEPNFGSSPAQFGSKNNGSASVPPLSQNGKLNAKFEASSPDSRSQHPNRGERCRHESFRNDRPLFSGNMGYREGDRDESWKPARSFHTPHEKLVSQDSPVGNRGWSNRPSHSDPNQTFSPNQGDFRGNHYGNRPERERLGHQGAGNDKQKPTLRDRSYDGGATNSFHGPGREFYVGEDGSKRYYNERSPNRNGATKRDNPDRGGLYDWGAYRSDRPSGNYNEHRYSYSQADNGGVYDGRRYDRQHEGMAAGFNNEKRLHDWARDRGVEASRKGCGQTPDGRAYYDAHGCRYDEGGEEHANYQRPRRYDRYEGYVDDHHNESSPRKKHRSRSSRDRNRSQDGSRDRHRRSGKKSRHSKERSSKRDSESPRKG